MSEKVSQKVDDLRVRRTRKLLQEAMVELTIQRGFVDVTVRDITERAMVNRSTFYRHYLDKYDLLSKCIEELIELLDAEEDEAAWDCDPNQPQNQPPAGLLRILNHVQKNADFYRVMLGKKGDPTFCAQSFRKFIEVQFHQMLSNQIELSDTSRPPIEMSVSYILYAGIGVIGWWLEQNQPCTPEQLAVWLNQFSTADIGVSLGLQVSVPTTH
jgi:AcrR family transcriptional regulator